MNLLFVCSRNQWRSPTAEAIFKNYAGHQAKSAGTEPSARIKINEKLILWADIIFVMEKKHRIRIQEKFPYIANGKPMIVLDIPDEYQFMDEDLVLSLKTAVLPYL
ncbi:low molecular weight protein tyrosine phosphatase family protein [Emticicia sp. 21SJ11W-3]|uniref:low molecular weight protein tyrosine phosphatase family protein n=1 Tax=Emticicia sp. 21SJ11W-3 TaxID=2916755 RepID=UPI0020A1B184|nr:protein tyrosine phosphatase [Emticicia sp. 21SJ11W-3]UTA69495.1 protein tyrosine phosphatase [Emticicia sp. 21SJ11W-3]